MANKYIDTFFMEIEEDFKDKFIAMSDRFEADIMRLQDDEDYNDVINELFRSFHSLKADAQHLNAKAMAKTFRYIEDVLDILRHKKPPVKQEIIDWLLILADTIKLWQEDVDHYNFEVEGVDEYTLNMIKISSLSNDKSDNVLANKTVLIVEPHAPTLKLLLLKLNKVVQKVYTAQDLKRGFAMIDKIKPDFFMLSAKIPLKHTVVMLEATKKYANKTINMLISEEGVSQEYLAVANRFTIESIIHPSQSKAEFLEGLERTAKQHFEKKWVLIADKKISQYIENLKPLSEAIHNIQSLSVDPEATVRDMANAVSNDPIITMNLLKHINSPLYGMKTKISNINHCVSMLGKEKTAAMVLQDGIKNALDPICLAPYGINEEKMFSISKKRMEFMTSWYAKEKFMMLPTLTTSALLGNIGQIIISKEVQEQKIGESFLSVVRRVGSTVAEAEFFNTTAEDITADIMDHWQMPKTLVNSIRYSYDLARADAEIKPYAIANYVVYNTLSNIHTEPDLNQVEQMSAFIKELNLNEEHYQNAVSKHF